MPAFISPLINCVNKPAQPQIPDLSFMKKGLVSHKTSVVVANSVALQPEERNRSIVCLHDRF